MKLTIYIISAVFLATCITSCSGGAFGNLIPLPKILDGEIIDEYYYPKNKSFKVKIPHPPSLSQKDTNEWTYTKVNEYEGDGMTKVIFGGAAMDLNYYHVASQQFDSVTLKSTSEAQLSFANDVFEQATTAQKYRSVHKSEQIHFENIKVRERPGFYAAYKLGPSQYLLVSIVFTDYGFFIIESDISRSSNDPSFHPSIETIKLNKFIIHNRLVKSFRPLI